MSKTIGIISIKGGVGKTTISASLASDLANNFGKKVLLIDGNFSAPNLGLHMDIVEPAYTIHEVLAKKIKINDTIHSRFNVDVIPGSYIADYDFNPLKLKKEIREIKENYDFVILDSSPSLNIEILSTIFASDNLFIVTTPDYSTLSCSIKAAKFAQQCGKTISGIVINKIHDSNYEFTLKDIEEALEIPVVAKIHYDKNAYRSAFVRIPAPLFNKKSNLSREINNLSRALTGQKEKRSFMQWLFPKIKKEAVNRQLLKENFYNSLFSQ